MSYFCECVPRNLNNKIIHDVENMKLSHFSIIIFKSIKLRNSRVILISRKYNSGFRMSKYNSKNNNILSKDFSCLVMKLI